MYHITIYYNNTEYNYFIQIDNNTPNKETLALNEACEKFQKENKITAFDLMMYVFEIKIESKYIYEKIRKYVTV